MADRLDSTRRMWSSGDYASVGDLFAEAGATLVEVVGVAGLEVLDIATGTGNTALAAARAGAKRVVGVDLTSVLLAEAGRRAAAAGFAVEWQEGDMEALGVPTPASTGCCRRSGPCSPATRARWRSSWSGCADPAAGWA